MTGEGTFVTVHAILSGPDDNLFPCLEEEIMPIYEFRCVQCGHIQEFLLKRSDEEVEMKCGECQGEDLERVMSTVGYAMGEPSSSASRSGNGCSMSTTSRQCGGNSCTTINLPGHTR